MLLRDAAVNCIQGRFNFDRKYKAETSLLTASVSTAGQPLLQMCCLLFDLPSFHLHSQHNIQTQGI